MIAKNGLIGIAIILMLGAPLLLAQAGAGGKQPALEVAAMRLQAEPVTVYEELPGRTMAYEIAEIRPQVNGIITERLFTEGSTVTQGQQLYQIDASTYKAIYDSARADLQKAEAMVKPLQAKNDRFADLVKIEAISQQEYDDIQADLAQAEAEIAIAKAALARAKINLDYTKVYAPISGRIGKSIVTKGALVTAGQLQPLAVITQLDPIYVDITQSSSDLLRLRRATSEVENLGVELLLDEEKSLYEHKGKLLFHEVSVEPTTGSVKLRTLFPNPDRMLLPGLFVRARLGLEYPHALLVPQRAALRQPDGGLVVWVVGVDDTVRPVNLTVSRAVGNSWLVESGVSDGDVIVTVGQMSLKPGALVTPVFAADTATETQKSGE